MKCPFGKCDGTGFILSTDERGLEEYIPCQCRLDKQKKDSLKRKLIEAKVPIKYWDYTIQNYMEVPFSREVKEANKHNLTTFQTYLSDIEVFLKSPQVLWIWGREANSCHTTLSIILGTELLKEDKKVVFLEFNKLLELFVDFDHKNDLLKDLHNHDIFIIDDAFDISRCVITKSNYRQGHLFTFINDILNANKHIICTSNVEIINMDPTFDQIKILLLRSAKMLEFRGCLTPYLSGIE